jgi:glycosyltransferase involved in cell wall biosynthesis
VGGCGSVVVHNVTGYCLDKKNFVVEATQKIASLCHNEAQYESFCWRAFYYYRKELDWDAIGKKAVTALQQVLNNQQDLAFSA